MSLRTRPSFTQGQPAFLPWQETDDFADFEARVDRGELNQWRDIEPRQATRDMPQYQLAQAGPVASQVTKPGPPDGVGQFQQYVKERFKLSDAEAAELTSHVKKWMGTPWNALDSLAIMGASGNANGFVSPRQDQAIRKMIEAVPREELRDRAKRGYDSTFEDGSLKVVDDPRRK